MKPNMTFEDLAKAQREALTKQGPTTTNEMRAQFLRLRGDFPNEEEALKFINTLSNEEYEKYLNGNNPILLSPDPQLIAAFEAEVEALVQEYNCLGYVPTRFINMLGNDGAFQTIKRLIRVKRPTSGFITYPEKLLSIEALVLKDQYKPLFTDDEKKYCRKLIFI